MQSDKNMAENCFKCKKSLNSKDQSSNNNNNNNNILLCCNNDNCMNKFHRTCANIDENVFEAINKNLVNFNCGECKDRYKVLLSKMNGMEEKINKLCMGINQMQARIFQQINFMQQNDAKKCNNNNNSMNNNNNNMHMNNLMVVGCNLNTDKLQVVCDYGRWVQVGKFATHTTEDDIIDYMADELKINKNLVKCTKLVKNDANLAQLSYCKFKISVPDYRFNDLFNENVWPSGVMVSPFTPRSQLNHNNRN